ncbi:MAG: glycosyl hydrolase family 18 protein [Syntrophomonas sp.]|nr:glycosyl hydrolase family 18 protein [Syntrophomonas sp.]
MKKVLGVIAFIFLLAFLFIPAEANVASGGPSIKIDEQKKTFDPPCQIVNQRTMVPLRFVIEDEALLGIVNWEAGSGKVTVSCREKKFEFLIGDRKVNVNGTLTYLDVAPYVYKNRTYLPLRFLAENLGGVVNWNSDLNEVSINFINKTVNNKPAVFAYYYWGGFPELQNNVDLFTDIALRWFETDGDGNLFYEYPDNYDKVLNYIKSQGKKTHASVVFMDKTGLHSLLSDPQRRAKLINNIYDEVHKNKYDGVNIDFEFIAASDKDLFTTFLKELRERLGHEKILSVAVFARTVDDKWPTAYDYRAIGGIVDKMVVMSYDYSYKNTDPGPIAPLWWVEKVVDYMTVEARIPASKLLLGMATYGYNWGTGLTTTTVTWEKLNNIRNDYAISEHFDKKSMSPYYTYTDKQGIKHEIWLENEQSLKAKWSVARDNNLGGISFWRIGNGFKDLYTVLEKNRAD